jgi:hypothetical protein
MATTAPGPETLRDAWREAEAEQAYWRDHHDEFLAKFPDQFVVVHGGQVVATDADLQQVILALQAKGLDPRHVWLRFMTSDPRRLLL